MTISTKGRKNNLETILIMMTKNREIKPVPPEALSTTQARKELSEELRENLSSINNNKLKKHGFKIIGTDYQNNKKIYWMRKTSIENNGVMVEHNHV